MLVDTGPLVALIDKRDQHHEWVQAQFSEILPPLLTCEAVLAESCHLTRKARDGTQATLELFERGVVRLAFVLDDNFEQVSSLLRRYADAPMSLADACLVRMSELVKESLVFTLDSHFRGYRRHKKQHIPLLIPRERATGL